MWYDVDIYKLAVQLLPPLLRGKVMLALLGVITLPLRFVCNLFVQCRQSTIAQLNGRANVVQLERVLNRAFFLKHTEIYIVSGDELPRLYWYFAANENIISGNVLPVELFYENEVSQEPSFIVHIPTFLCTSLDREQDKFGGVHLDKIKLLLNQYKPAGRTYRFELYDYE